MTFREKVLVFASVFIAEEELIETQSLGKIEKLVVFESLVLGAGVLDAIDLKHQNLGPARDEMRFARLNLFVLKVNTGLLRTLYV